mgnify:CR=1 FL=1
MHRNRANTLNRQLSSAPILINASSPNRHGILAISCSLGIVSLTALPPTLLDARYAKISNVTGALPPNPPPTKGTLTWILPAGIVNASANCFLTEYGACDDVVMRTLPSDRIYALAVRTSIARWSDGGRKNRCSTIEAQRLNALSTSPFLMRYLLAILVPLSGYISLSIF